MIQLNIREDHWQKYQEAAEDVVTLSRALDQMIVLVAPMVEQRKGDLETKKGKPNFVKLGTMIIGVLKDHWRDFAKLGPQLPVILEISQKYRNKKAV